MIWTDKRQYLENIRNILTIDQFLFDTLYTLVKCIFSNQKWLIIQKRLAFHQNICTLLILTENSVMHDDDDNAIWMLSCYTVDLRDHTHERCLVLSY